MEMLLLGAGGCTGFDVVTILEKMRRRSAFSRGSWTPNAPTDPTVFTKIHMHFVVAGEDLKPKPVEHAVTLSAEKYCSASIMLGKAGVEITHDFEIEGA